MRKLFGFGLLAVVGGTAWMLSSVAAQPPEARGPERPPGGRRTVDPARAVERMMSLDANHDGSLSMDEVKDNRLVALFERSDANSDGTLTKEELVDQLNKDAVSLNNSPDMRPPFGDGPGPRGPGGPGGPGFPGGPGGFAGPPGRGGPEMAGPPAGMIMPRPLQHMLRLSVTQTREIDALQKHVDQKLAEILTEDQKHQLDELRSRGPMGPGPRAEGFGPGPERFRDRGPGGPGPRPERDRPRRPPADEPPPN